MTTDVKSLNQILINNPKKIFHSSIVKAEIFKIAYIINITCILIFSVYFLSFISVSSAILPISNVLTSIAIPILSTTFIILNKTSKYFYKTASFYKNILIELNSLKTQSKDQIKKYLYNIKCTKIKNESLIINAIAYYKVWNKKKDFFLNEIIKTKNIKTHNLKLKYKIQELAYNIYINEVLNAKIKLAHIYHVINNPNDKKTLNDYGKIIPLSPSPSINENSNYCFVFNNSIQKQRKKKGLSFTEIDELEINDISKLIYPT